MNESNLTALKYTSNQRVLHQCKLVGVLSNISDLITKTTLAKTLLLIISNYLQGIQSPYYNWCGIKNIETNTLFATQVSKLLLVAKSTQALI